MAKRSVRIGATKRATKGTIADRLTRIEDRVEALGILVALEFIHHQALAKVPLPFTIQPVADKVVHGVLARAGRKK